MVEKHIGKSIKILRSDQGGEYKSRDFNKYCKDHGIVQQFIVPHTPQQNRVVERKNLTLVECARSMMKGKNLSNAFWVEAINIAVYLKNRSPKRCLDNVTPFEALYGSKPVVHNLIVFGCKAFAHIPKENRKKLDAKAIKCIFIGYYSEFKAYKLFDPATHKVFASKDVLFHEQEVGNHDDNSHEDGIEFLMKDLKKSNNNINHHNNNNHNRSDNNNNNNKKKKKDSVIWTIQIVTIHLEAKTDLHKVGSKIIS
jgi:hypothetical protein